MNPIIYFSGKYLLLFILLSKGILFANDDIKLNYTPLDRSAPPKEIINEIKLIGPIQVDKHHKEFKEVSESLNRYFLDKMDSSNYYFDDFVYPFVKNVFNTIINSNPEIKSLPIKILVSRSTVPNAFAMPNGIIEVNMGLLRYLEHEDQLAFIIAHEIAHIYLKHSVKGYTQFLDQVKSKEFQKEVSNISKSEYLTYTKSVELAKKIVYNDRKHTRSFELEADSLGLVYLSKTKYSTFIASEGILILEKFDQEKLTDSLLLSEIFHTENYPFKPRWIKENSFIKSVDTLSKEQLDSLKTHPDTDLRHLHLKNVIANQNIPNNKSDNNSTEFEKIKMIADFECLSNLYHDKVISYSTYLNLKLLQIYPDNIYLKSMLIKNLQKIKEGLDQMELSRYIRRPNPFDTGDYKQLILMLNSIRPSEIDIIIKEMSNKYSIN